MKNLVIRSYEPSDIAALIGLQEKFKQRYPDYIVRGANVYTEHPVFENGENILCAFDMEGQLLAYAPFAPAPVDKEAVPELYHMIWADLIYGLEHPEIKEILDRLIDKVLERAKVIRDRDPGRATRLVFQKFSTDEEGIRYFSLKGFEHYESVYSMKRGLDKPLDVTVPVNGLTVKRWKLSSNADKEAYIKADNSCFPNNPMTIERLNWHLEKQWVKGTAIGAFDSDNQLCGNMMAYWFDSTEAITEEIFVIEPWRGKGVAKLMITEALNYLKENRMTTAELQVTASNRNALKLYEQMGYEIFTEECNLGRML